MRDMAPDTARGLASDGRLDVAPGLQPDAPEGTPGLARTVASYFAAFAPAPAWDDLASWPPDVFTLANLILDHTEGYRFVVAPLEGRRWPPRPGWTDEVSRAALAWRAVAGDRRGELPALVRRCWDTVTRYRETPLAAVRTGERWELNEALLTLHSIADEACADVAGSGSRAADGSFEAEAWRRLQEGGSLSRLSPTRVRIVPKTHLSALGITIRSLSRYLALCYESVDVTWGGVPGDVSPDCHDYNILLLPWPLSIKARDFRPARALPVQGIGGESAGFFEFAPDEPFRHAALAASLDAALEVVDEVDVVVLPEGAVHADEIGEIERILHDRGVSFLIAGVRHPARAGGFGRNYLHFGVRSDGRWCRHEQDKHHRWCLDARQIRQYHLTRALDPGRLWWEAIDVCERRLHIVDVGRGVTTAPLVCEDLARLDEVADLVRRIGPSLVVALLMDGPQIASRWPCRYASILVDEPGSSVLTLTSYGMAMRSRPPGKKPSRVVAHWNNKGDGLREIELARGADSILLSAALEGTTLWTADGRRHPDVPGLRLVGVHQLRTARRGVRPARSRAG